MSRNAKVTLVGWRLSGKLWRGCLGSCLCITGFTALAQMPGSANPVAESPELLTAVVGNDPANAATDTLTDTATPHYHGHPVTLDFQDVPLRSALQVLAQEAKINLVMADAVQGALSLRLVNVPWDQALDVVLRAKGLDQRQLDDVTWIGPQTELAKLEREREDARIAMENRQQLETGFLQINYHSAEAIYKALTEAKGLGSQGKEVDGGFLSPRGRLVADPRTNMLMVSDIPARVARLRELVARIDRPVDQVLIESRIVVATESFARDLGVRFGVASTRDHASVGADVDGSGRALGGLNVNLAAGHFTSGMPASIGYALLGRHFNVDLALSAMQEEGEGEVISNPRIVTSNQREGVVRQGKEIGYVTVTGGSSGNARTPDVQFKEALLELKVTPTITDDQRIFLDMNLKKDEVDDYIDLSEYGTVPIINRREINTAMLVGDGETVMIGGVHEFSDRKSLSKVPFLADIPLLGHLFRKHGRGHDRAELLVFVTPRLLKVAPAHTPASDPELQAELPAELTHDPAVLEPDQHASELSKGTANSNEQ